MGILKKALNVVSPIASVINKSGPVAKMLGMEKKKAVARPMSNMMASLANDPKAKNALEAGKARIAPVKAAGMKKGGKVKKMAYGGKVKSGSSASRRADGCAVKGRTKGRIV